MLPFSCSFSNGKLLSSSLFFGQLNLLFVLSGDGIGLLSNSEFNVAVACKIGRNTTVSAVCASTSTNSTLNNNMVNEATVEVQAFSLSIGSQVDEEFTDGFDRLLGPSSKSSVFINFDLSVAANTSCESSVWNNLSVLSALFKIVNSFVELETFD